MKKLLLFVTMAAALLFTQCKKDDKNSMPSAGKTVKMTVTAGPGSKTDIADDGAIKWSAGDKLYVGYEGEYIGYLTLMMGGESSATGTFSGDVDLPTSVKDGDKPTFHFFYLGSEDYTNLEKGATTVYFDFSNQDIYKNGKKLENASAQHVGYGTAKGTVTGNMVTDINVMMVSKVALARFNFTESDSKDAYEGKLTLSGDNIYNKMTVGFDGTFEGTSGSTTDGITLAAGHGERYVMLVPTSAVADQTLTFAGDNVSGTATLEKGILPNQFYDKAIEVTLTAPAPTFTVDKDGTKPRTVEFSKGNLYYNSRTKTFHFENYQHSYTAKWDAEHVGHFNWSKTASVAYAETYSDVSASTGDVFFTNNPSDDTKPNSNFQVDGEKPGTWRTLSKNEWIYLLSTRGGNMYAKARVNTVSGLLLFPDNYQLPTGYDEDGGTGMKKVNSNSSSYPDVSIDEEIWEEMEERGVVFLPAPGNRQNGTFNTTEDYGNYWSSTCDGKEKAYRLRFTSSEFANQGSYSRLYGYAVRLVRDL